MSLRQGTELMETKSVLQLAVEKLQDQYENCWNSESRDAVRREVWSEAKWIIPMPWGALFHLDRCVGSMPMYVNREVSLCCKDFVSSWRCFTPDAMNSIALLMGDCVTCTMVRPTDSKTLIRFVKMGMGCWKRWDAAALDIFDLQGGRMSGIGRIYGNAVQWRNIPYICVQAVNCNSTESFNDEYDRRKKGRGVLWLSSVIMMCDYFALWQ